MDSSATGVSLRTMIICNRTVTRDWMLLALSTLYNVKAEAMLQQPLNSEAELLRATCACRYHTKDKYMHNL